MKAETVLAVVNVVSVDYEGRGAACVNGKAVFILGSFS